MKKALFALTALATLFVSTSAFAAPPVCSASDAKGTVCWSNSNPPSLQTSCGGGKYVSGSVTNAGTLDDQCFSAGAKYDANGNPIKATSLDPIKEKSTVK